MADGDYDGPERRASDGYDGPERRAATDDRIALVREAAERAARLAREDADRAARLAREDADRQTQLAVERAKKDAAIEHELKDHREHLEAINGSQRQMAASLLELSSTRARQVAVDEAMAAELQRTHDHAVSRKTLLIMGAAAIAAYISLAVALLTGTHF